MNEYQELIRPQDCLLLLVDVQRVMLDLCVNPERTVMNAQALIEVAQLFELPIFCSVHNVEKLGGIIPELTDKISQPKILNKMEFNCFENEDIARAIRRAGRKNLVLAGLEGHVCIFHTGLGALRLGYGVHVISDAVTSRRDSDKQIGMRRLEKAGAVISSTEMFIFEMLTRAGTPEFRALLPLLKKLQSN